MADTLEEIMIRHLVFLQRLVPSLSRDVIRNIDQNNAELRGVLYDFLEKNELFKLTAKQQADLAVLRNKVEKLRGGAILDASEKYQADMLTLAEKEQLFFAKGVEDLGSKALTLSSTSALNKMVERTPFVGQNISQIYKSLAQKDVDTIMATTEQGLTNGLTLDQIQRSIFGTKKLNYTDGVLNQTRLKVNRPDTNSGIVRTTVNGIQNEALNKLYNANSDIIKEEVVNATMDGRTSKFCFGEHGNVYPLNVGPQFPAHINCRTQRLPKVEGISIDSTQPIVYDTRTRKEREKDFRAEAKAEGISIKAVREKWANQKIGVVSTKLTGEQVMRNAPVAFQKEYLGATKYKLWKDGGMKLERFTDPLAKPYTLDELYQIDKNAFKQAGVDKPK